MPALDGSGWWAVDSIAGSNALRGLEAAVAKEGVSCARFRSAAGAEALLIPIAPLAGSAVPGIAVMHAPADGEVLFVDPAGGADLPALLDAFGERAVLVALSGAPGTPGLGPEVGRITVAPGDGSPATYRLHHRGGAERLNLRDSADRHDRADPRELGEGEDVLDQRSKWFGTREGPAK